MKTLLKIIIVFGLVLNINAQSIERTSFEISINDKTKSTLKLDKKLLITKGFLLDVSPQFGNLFITQFGAKKAKINLKDFYDDFDFGIKVGVSSNFKKNLKIKALYNIGMLKFEKHNIEKEDGYAVKLSIDYVF
jgi:hypothetical protein